MHTLVDHVLAAHLIHADQAEKPDTILALWLVDRLAMAFLGIAVPEWVI